MTTNHIEADLKIKREEKKYVGFIVKKMYEQKSNVTNYFLIF